MVLALRKKSILLAGSFYIWPATYLTHVATPFLSVLANTTRPTSTDRLARSRGLYGKSKELKAAEGTRNRSIAVKIG